MVDACTVDRQTGPGTPDPVTLEIVPDYAVQYVGKCRIQRSNAISPSDDVAGGFEFGIGTLLAQLPLSVTGILPGDRLTITALSAQSDPDLLGMVATVRANLTKTHPTKRTPVAEEVS